MSKSEETFDKVRAPGYYAEHVYDGHGTPYVRGRKAPPDTKLCSVTCMPGLNGKCVLCDNHD